MPTSGWHRVNRNTAAVKARRAKYNSPEHKAARAHLKILVASGRAYCWRCGKQLVPGNWHVGHNDPGTRIMGGECARECNLRAAARKGARIANAKRKAAAFIRPTR